MNSEIFFKYFFFILLAAWKLVPSPNYLASFIYRTVCRADDKGLYQGVNNQPTTENNHQADNGFGKNFLGFIHFAFVAAGNQEKYAGHYEQKRGNRHGKPENDKINQVAEQLP